MKPIADLVEKLSRMGEENKEDGAGIEDTVEGFFEYIKEKFGMGKDKEGDSHSKSVEDKQKTYSFPDFDSFKELFEPGASGGQRTKRTLGKKNRSFGDVLENLIYSKIGKDPSRRSTADRRAELVEFYRKKYGL